MDKKEIISRVEKLLKERKGIVMVLTVDKFSMPHGRYMDCTRGDDNLSLYFATFVNTEKVEQLKNNPNAEVVVTGKNFVETANLSGVMNFYDAEKDKIAAGKKSFLISRFPGLRPEDIVILKFTPKAIKYLDQKAPLRPLPIYKVVL